MYIYPTFIGFFGHCNGRVKEGDAQEIWNASQRLFVQPQTFSLDAKYLPLND